MYQMQKHWVVVGKDSKGEVCMVFNWWNSHEEAEKDLSIHKLMCEGFDLSVREMYLLVRIDPSKNQEPI